MHPSSFKHMAQKVEQYLAQSASLRIVDIGSQDLNGSFRSLFKKTGWHYTGVDLCAGTNVDVVLDDPYHFPFSADSIDVIISGFVFEHVEFFWKTFTEMCRVVRPGGMIILIMPSRGPEHRYPVDCWRFYPDAMNALARLCSVELVETHTDWDDTGVAGSKLWGDTVGVFRMPTADNANEQKLHFDHPDIMVRELLGESGLLIPSSCNNHEENLLRAVLHGEEYQLPILPSRLNESPVFDVGANLGMFSMAVRRQFPDMPIHAVEPSTRNIAILSHNLGKMEQVQIHPCGLGDRDGYAIFHLGGASSGLADSLYNNRLSSENCVEVEVLDAKRLFESHVDGELAILKLDTEGHEVPILSRLKDKLPFIAAILVEYHSEHDRRAIDDLLKAGHDLYFSNASVPHRGTCCYLRRDIIAETGENIREIKRE